MTPYEAAFHINRVVFQVLLGLCFFGMISYAIHDEGYPVFALLCGCLCYVLMTGCEIAAKIVKDNAELIREDPTP